MLPARVIPHRKRRAPVCPASLRGHHGRLRARVGFEDRRTSGIGAIRRLLRSFPSKAGSQPGSKSVTEDWKALRGPVKLAEN